MINNNIPYLSKEKPTFLALSAAIALLLLSTPLPLSNVLVQPVQAQTTLTFRTPEPASSDRDGCFLSPATLTFDAQGTASSSDPQHVDITSGPFKVTNIRDKQQSYSGTLEAGSFTNNSVGSVELLA